MGIVDEWSFANDLLAVFFFLLFLFLMVKLSWHTISKLVYFFYSLLSFGLAVWVVKRFFFSFSPSGWGVAVSYQAIMMHGWAVYGWAV